MAIFRCKMCGGDLEVIEGSASCTCEFCGTKQTLPTITDEALQSLFNRANVLRMKSEFDKAADVYEKILQRSETEAEAYWGLILCKYGIEYVEDPATFKRIPTCHRASYDAVTTDEDYKNALRYADAAQRAIYEAEAAAIDEIQRGIIALAQKEDPYDVFICYKETDESGKRTQDSVIANDIYHQLTMEGFKVFYAAITLEDKLGKEYEPYIFSALNTAKVMLALGTKPEYFSAVWVRNEWSRFLKIMKKDRSKLLIPCYRGMDPYELPEEFSHLQAQDMSKIGFISDLTRGIRKVLVKETEQPKEQEKAASQQAASVSGTTTAAQIKRGNMALEDHEWVKADGFFEEALNLDPECAEAYVGKLLARDEEPGFVSWVTMQKEKYASATTERLEACPEDTAHIKKMCSQYALEECLTPDSIRKVYPYDRTYPSALSCRRSQKTKHLAELSSDRLLARAQQYAKEATHQQIEDAIAAITAVLDQRIAEAKAEDEASIARVKKAYEAHIADTDSKVEAMNADASSRQEEVYQNAVSAMKAADSVFAYDNAKKLMKAMYGYKDSDALADKCQQEIDRLNEEERKERERQAAIERESAARAAKKRKTITAIVAAIAALSIAAYAVVTMVIIPNNKYNAAVTLMDAGKYEEAIAAFTVQNGYKDSEAQIENCYIGKFGKEEWEAIKNIKVGDKLTFGSYEQDNNASNGKEAIEWVVLDRDGFSLLLISQKALDYESYYASGKFADTTWETGPIRIWLNGKFLNNAFSAEERNQILSTTISANKDEDYSANSNNATADKLFLLSKAEAEKYFTSDSARQCKPTKYAITNGVAAGGSNENCMWWLRSYTKWVQVDNAGIINDYSIVTYGDYEILPQGCGVRPAMWITLDP